MPFGIINNSKEYLYERSYRMQTAKGNISSRRNINKILLEYWQAALRIEMVERELQRRVCKAAYHTTIRLMFNTKFKLTLRELEILFGISSKCAWNINAAMKMGIAGVCHVY